MLEAKRFWLHLNCSAKPGTSTTYTVGFSPEPSGEGDFGGGYPTVHYTSWEVLLAALRQIRIPERTIDEAARELKSSGYYLIQDVSLTQEQLIDLGVSITQRPSSVVNVTVNKKSSGTIQVCVSKPGHNPSPVQDYRSLEEAKRVLLELGFTEQEINSCFTDLAEFNPNELVRMGQREIPQNVLWKRGFKL